MRLQVFLSHSGACSRRKALELVKKGSVSVNNRTITEPSYPVDPEKDKVCLSGEKITLKKSIYILLNKPKGITTTRRDKYAERTVMDLLPDKFRHLYPVGRLDKDTEGLLVLTNDGDLAYRLTHPKFNIAKKYSVQIKGKLEASHKDILEKGLFLDGKKTYPCRIKVVRRLPDNTEIEMTLHEGRKRQIKLMFSHFGYKVVNIKRESQGPLKLSGLKKGQWRCLDDREVRELRHLAGLN